MKLPAKTLVLFAVIVNLAIVGVISFRHQERKHTAADVDLKAAAPEIYDRLKQQIATLRRESTAESLDKLADVNLFYWPGPPASKGSSGGFVVEYLPLGEEVGQADLQAICSNRRFSKLVEHLSTMKPTAVSKLVNEDLARTAAEYLKLYDAEMLRFASHYTLDKMAGQTSITGPTFVTGNVLDGKVVITGARLKILALVWICGALELTGCKANVEQVARIAINQRMSLYAEPTLHPFFKSEMLKRASLYNRQIISSALLGMAGNSDIMKELGLQWQERKLASYQAALTEFDLPVQSGAMKPDYSLGIQTIKFTSPLDDSRFDQLIKKYGIVP